jgi:hypothetical protein
LDRDYALGELIKKDATIPTEVAPAEEVARLRAGIKGPTSASTAPDQVPKRDGSPPAPPGGPETTDATGSDPPPTSDRRRPKLEHLRVLAKAIDSMLIHTEHRRSAKAISLWTLIQERLQGPESRVPFLISNKDIVIHCHNKTGKRKEEELLTNTGEKAIKNTIQETRDLGRHYHLPYELEQVGRQGVVVKEKPTQVF